MSETTIKYKTHAISTDILSVLDVVSEGKVVSAENWNTLWKAVFTSINGIDAYCLTIDELRMNWEASEENLDAKVNLINKKYNALETSFVHYGEEPPTNEHIKLWVQPVNNVNENTLATVTQLRTSVIELTAQNVKLEQDLTTRIAAKVDKLTPLSNVPELVLYQPDLTSKDKYILKQYVASEDITSLQFKFPDGRFSTITSWEYTIPAGATVTIVYSRGATANQQYAARITIFIDMPWIIKTGTINDTKTASASSGYYAIDYEINKSNESVNVNNNLSYKFYKVADVNIARTTSITLDGTKWSTSAPYSQVLNISNITANSKIDLTPTPTQLNIFYTQGYAFIIENKNKTVTAYCIGNKPTESYTITATIMEVVK